MDRLICRDCGNELNTGARGCPRCALNFEVEQKIDRIVWRGIVPVIVLFAVIVAALLYWSR